MTDAAEKSTFVVDANTLFVLGNGPSLRSVNLHDLTPFATLGMNAAYRYWKEIGWRPRYYACLDLVVGMSHRDAIAELVAETGEGAIRRFLLRENLIAALGPLSRSERVLNFDALQLAFPKLGVTPITTGSHAALWAAAEGFRKIVLLGVDGKYVERVDGARPRGGIELEIVEEKANPNYFFDGYQRKGDRYNIPNPRPGLHVEAWEAAASVLRAEGVDIVNANPNSEIRFFPWVSAENLIASGSTKIDSRNVVPAAAWCGDTHPPDKEGGRAGDIVARLKAFARRQRTPLLATFIAMLSGLLGVAAAPGGSPRMMLLLVLATAVALVLLGVFVRDAVSRRIAALDRRMAAVEALAADIMRRADGEANRRGRGSKPDAMDRSAH